MITGKHRDRDAVELRNFAALPARQPYCKLFETAKTSRWLGERLLPQSCDVGCVHVADGQIATEGADIV
jgi:hypothetical protein